MPIYPFRLGDPSDARLEKETSHNNGAPATDGMAKRLGRFILFWIKISWADILGMILLAIAENLVSPALPPREGPMGCTNE
jgi:diacylglycerol diphosphate phosphatase/phosphatidate phosphatase